MIVDEGEALITANLGQVFLFHVPYLIAIFLFTFAIFKKVCCKPPEEYCKFAKPIKNPYFLLEVPHFQLGKCVLFAVPKLTFILLYFRRKDYFRK